MLLLTLDRLSVAFSGARRRDEPVAALSDLSLKLAPGRVLSLIGESGSGKSTALRAIAGLLPPNALVSGEMTLQGRPGNLLAPGAGRRGVAGREIGMIFQNPGASFNPVLSIGDHLMQVLRAHDPAPEAALQARARDLLARVGLPDPARLAGAFPHQISGGQKQRAAIAAALAGGPRLILADEPTTALDATVQAQILDLLLRLVDEEGISLIFVTHDLAVATAIGDETGVMKDGRLIEFGPSREIASAPGAPYTQALVAAALPFTRAAAAPPPPASAGGEGLRMKGIAKMFDSRGAGRVTAVDDVDLRIAPGEILGLIGESGSGKSTIGRIAAGLTAPDAGAISLNGAKLDPARGLSKTQRAAIQLVFQDPLASFNPRRPVGDGLRAPLRIHAGLRGRAAAARTAELFEACGLCPMLAARLPRALSGGQLQRAAIARALATNPALVICDEAVASLDVSVRAQVLDLLGRLRREEGLAVLFISHDLGVVQRIANRTMVLHKGRVVEEGPTRDVLGAPQQDYTKRLVASVPQGLAPWRARIAGPFHTE